MTATRALRCDEIVELVTDYLEDALDPDTAGAFDAHLTVCPGCALYVDQIRETVATLGAVSCDDLSPRAQDELVAAFRAFRRPDR